MPRKNPKMMSFSGFSMVCYELFPIANLPTKNTKDKNSLLDDFFQSYTPHTVFVYDKIDQTMFGTEYLERLPFQRINLKGYRLIITHNGKSGTFRASVTTTLYRANFGLLSTIITSETLEPSWDVDDIISLQKNFLSEPLLFLSPVSLVIEDISSLITEALRNQTPTLHSLTQAYISTICRHLNLNSTNELNYPYRHKHIFMDFWGVLGNYKSTKQIMEKHRNQIMGLLDAYPDWRNLDPNIFERMFGENIAILTDGGFFIPNDRFSGIFNLYIKRSEWRESCLASIDSTGLSWTELPRLIEILIIQKFMLETVNFLITKFSEKSDRKTMSRLRYTTLSIVGEYLAIRVNKWRLQEQQLQYGRNRFLLDDIYEKTLDRAREIDGILNDSRYSALESFSLFIGIADIVGTIYVTGLALYWNSIQAISPFAKTSLLLIPVLLILIISSITLVWRQHNLSSWKSIWEGTKR